MNPRPAQSSTQAPNETWQSEVLESLQPQDQKRERADLAMSVMEETPPQAVLDRSREEKEAVDKGEKPRDWSWMPSPLKIAVGLGAAYLTWKVFSKLWSKKEEKEEGKEEGFFSTAEKLIGLATLGGVGWLVGKEAIPGYFKDKMDLEAKGDSVKRFLAKLKEKGLKDAIGELNIDSDEKYLVRMAEAIEVEKKYALNLRDVTYEAFLAHRKEQISGEVGYATMQIAEVVGFDMSTNIPFTSADDDLREANADAKIQAYIEKHTSKEERKKHTVGELLEMIDKKENPEAYTSDNSEPQEEGESEETPARSEISDDPNVLEKHAKHVSALTKSWAEGPKEGEPETTVYQKAGALVDATAEDGGQLFCYDGVLYLLQGGAVMVLSSCSFFADTVCDVAQAAATEEKSVGDVVTSFLERGGLTYVGGGMAIGVAAAYLQKAGILNGSGSVIKEAFKGAGRGIIAPFNIFKGTAMGAKTAYAGAEWARDQYRFLSFSKKELLDPRNALLYKQGKAAWAAEEFLKTFEEANLEKTARWNWEGIKIKAKASILPENVKQLRKRYLDWFISSRREYMASAHLSATEFDKWHVVLEGADLSPAAEEAHRFLAEVKASNTAASLRTLGEAANRPAGVETPRAKIDRLKLMATESDKYMRTAIDERESMVRRGIRGTELDTFDQQVRAHLSTSGRDAESLLDELSRGTLSHEEKVALNAIVRKELSSSLGIKAVVSEVKGRGVMSVVIGTGYLVYEAYEANEAGKDMLIDGELTEIGKQIGWETLATIINVLCPFGLTDFYTAAMGEEIITNRELGGWERALRLGMGTYSAVTDVIGVLAAVATSPAAGTGGVGVYAGANAVEAAVRMSLRGLGASDELIATGTRLIPRLTELARKVGGYKELLLRLQKVARGTGLAMAGATAAFMGYTVLYDTKGSKEIQFATADMPEVPGEQSTETAETVAQAPDSRKPLANQAPSERQESRSSAA